MTTGYPAKRRIDLRYERGCDDARKNNSNFHAVVTNPLRIQASQKEHDLNVQNIDCIDRRCFISPMPKNRLGGIPGLNKNDGTILFQLVMAGPAFVTSCRTR